MIYTLYYRNYLTSCNYRCGYCPFPKKLVHIKKLDQDREYLQKFVHFLANSHKQFKVFFAPQGEALLYEHYQQALITLSKQANISEVVIQTNLSGDLAWLTHVNPAKLITWATYHPSEVAAAAFVNQLKMLSRHHVRFTVGVVGVRTNFAKIKEMKQLLTHIHKYKPYMWINAYKYQKHYYHAADIAFLQACDPLFAINLKDYQSKDLACKTGESVFFVDWRGNIHRCWQDRRKIGNLYTDDLDAIRLTSNCVKHICGCFIGYSHIKTLKLDEVYQTSLLGRMP